MGLIMIVTYGHVIKTILTNKDFYLFILSIILAVYLPYIEDNSILMNLHIISCYLGFASKLLSFKNSLQLSHIQSKEIQIADVDICFEYDWYIWDLYIQFMCKWINGNYLFNDDFIDIWNY